jgi:PPK2 family polyphosphate:nucleotide phosphotransferase
MKLHPVTDKRSIHLGDDDARIDSPFASDEELEDALRRESERLSDLQRVLYADGRFALLVVLQGRDASGKDGTIRKVFSALNPQGCSVASFKPPTELEQRHDFLWRVHMQVPPKSMIAIFNRSHYEDILMPRVHGLLPRKVWFARYDQINDWERMLAENGVVILKFMLHVSRDEQKKRLLERLSDPTKRWKFKKSDLDDRERWDDFTRAYRGVLSHTSTRDAPWYVVPADDKRLRNYLVARAVADGLQSLDLRYPPGDESVVGIEIH